MKAYQFMKCILRKNLMWTVTLGHIWSTKKLSIGPWSADPCTIAYIVLKLKRKNHSFIFSKSECTDSKFSKEHNSPKC